MRKEPAIETTSPATLTVLSVSPHQEDHLSLEAIIGHSRWTLLKADKLPSAWALLQAHDIPVVLCESDLKPGTWIDMLKDIQGMPTAPALIVTSISAGQISCSRCGKRRVGCRCCGRPGRILRRYRAADCHSRRAYSACCSRRA